jgi:hypothetical protein
MDRCAYPKANQSKCIDVPGWLPTNPAVFGLIRSHNVGPPRGSSDYVVSREAKVGHVPD